MLKLLKVEITDNFEVTGMKNALQFIDRAPQGLFLEYSEDLKGAIYLIKASSFKYIAIELDTWGIDYQVITKHNIKA